MTHTVITHIGVSALSCEALLGFQSQNYATIDQELADGMERPETLEIAQRDLLRGLRRHWGQKKEARQHRAVSPAEIAALSLLLAELRPDGNPPLPIDRLVLVRSDTPGGRFCADLLKRAFVDPDREISRQYGYPHVSGDPAHFVIAPIEGLRITDERTPDPDSDKEAFVRTGLVNYVRTVYAEYRRLGAGDTLTFNITSGFKGLVPAARDLALLLSTRRGGPTIEMVYLYKSSNELIRYNLFPLQFDWDSLPIDLLRRAGAGAAPPDQLSGAQYAYLFEQRGTAIQKSQRSALGEVVWALHTLLHAE
jgi:CRISPR-associated protein (Cas_APE2256)